MLCFHGMPKAFCALWGKGECSSSSPRSRALLVPSPKLLLEQQNSTHGAAWLAEAQWDLLQIHSPREGCEQLLIPGRTELLLLLLLGCSYIPFLPAQGTPNFCHVCSQHTGSGSCTLQLLLFQQNHRFCGTNFIEDQMNPVFSSISTDQPTALISFCQKMGRNKRRIT